MINSLFATLQWRHLSVVLHHINSNSTASFTSVFMQTRKKPPKLRITGPVRESVGNCGLSWASISEYWLSVHGIYANHYTRSRSGHLFLRPIWFYKTLNVYGVVFNGLFPVASLRWRHNERYGVSNHRRLYCLLNRLFKRRSKKTSKLRVTGLCAGNSPVAGEIPRTIVILLIDRWDEVMQKTFPCANFIMHITSWSDAPVRYLESVLQNTITFKHFGMKLPTNIILPNTQLELFTSGVQRMFYQRLCRQ